MSVLIAVENKEAKIVTIIDITSISQIKILSGSIIRYWLRGSDTSYDLNDEQAIDFARQVSELNIVLITRPVEKVFKEFVEGN